MDPRRTDQANTRIRRNQLALISVCMIGAMVTFLWLDLTPEGVFGKLHAVGYAVCHQIAMHSFAFNGQVFPLCARCTGMYLGALVGLVIQFVGGKKRGGFSKKGLIGFGILSIFFIADGVNSFASLAFGHPFIYEPQNWVRLVTGFGAGFLLAAIIYPLFTQTLWKDWQIGSALDGWMSILVMVLVGAGMSVGLLLKWKAATIPLSLLSILGVLVILSLIYTVLLVTLFKRDNIYRGTVEALPMMIGGFVIAMIHIGVFDLARYLLTNTWNGLTL